MKPTKTFMLAAVAALTIGTGAAMAQSQVPNSGQGDFWQHQSTPRVITGPVQSGSSDVETGYRVASDYTTLANPG
jgi:hypothetical protein